MWNANWELCCGWRGLKTARTEHGPWTCEFSLCSPDLRNPLLMYTPNPHKFKSFHLSHMTSVVAMVTILLVRLAWEPDAIAILVHFESGRAHITSV